MLAMDFGPPVEKRYTWRPEKVDDLKKEKVIKKLSVIDEIFRENARNLLGNV